MSRRISASFGALTLMSAVGCGPIATNEVESPATRPASTPAESEAARSSGSPAHSSSASDASADALVRVALSDPRFAAFLDRHRYVVRSTETVTMEDGRRGLIVVITLDPAVDPLEWPPGEACLIARESPLITGVVWLVDVETATIAAVSPQWDGSVDCIQR